MTVHSWGENPRGTWHLEVHNDASAHWGSEAKFHTWTLELFGSEFDPNAGKTRATIRAKIRPSEAKIATKRNLDFGADEKAVADLLVKFGLFCFN